MKVKLALLLAMLSLVLSGCGYAVIEAGEVQVGSAQVTAEPTAG